MNGWHALSGFLVALPLFAALRPSWAAPFDVAAAAALIATGIWALLEPTRRPGSSTSRTRAATRSCTSPRVIFAAGALHHYVLAQRRTPPA